MILHFSHIGLAEGRTFMFPVGCLTAKTRASGNRPAQLPSFGVLDARGGPGWPKARPRSLAKGFAPADGKWQGARAARIRPRRAAWTRARASGCAVRRP